AGRCTARPRRRSRGFSCGDYTFRAMLKIELLDWPAAEELAKRIRFTVFVEEQGVPPELEMDDNDTASLHALAYAEGRAIGTGRLLPDGHLGRREVLSEWGGEGAGSVSIAMLVEVDGG